MWLGAAYVAVVKGQVRMTIKKKQMITWSESTWVCTTGRVANFQSTLCLGHRRCWCTRSECRARREGWLRPRLGSKKSQGGLFASRKGTSRAYHRKRRWKAASGCRSRGFHREAEAGAPPDAQEKGISSIPGWGYLTNENV